MVTGGIFTLLSSPAFRTLLQYHHIGLSLLIYKVCIKKKTRKKSVEIRTVCNAT